ncbi:50S ribosomal protein L13, chloroplastic-like [Andrographis paniculata]|uniref:50S ribosomal protein L13, chloroplastic-like n=1 Tax=Andrographis paniculata TaxID=175694 RepID=UPI0021E962C2|nr:50S ribosomal protein L13, chloroplastic-like [Andrographis paniculata]
MAVHLATTPMFLGTTSSFDRGIPFLGFPLASTSRPYTRVDKVSRMILCQNKQAALVPAEQQWMFDCITGPDVLNKTWYPKASDHVNTDKPWYVVDATDKILGRLASTIAIYIRGKYLATYTPSVDMGAFVIVVNAENVAVSGKKRVQKLYRRHSGQPGGMKVETFDQLQRRIPERIIEHAVRGMLPKGRLGRSLFNHLKVYAGPNHPHEAQKPVDLPLRDKRIQNQGY